MWRNDCIKLRYGTLCGYTPYTQVTRKVTTEVSDHDVADGHGPAHSQEAELSSVLPLPLPAVADATVGADAVPVVTVDVAEGEGATGSKLDGVVVVARVVAMASRIKAGGLLSRKTMLFKIAR
jgi:hypothetical protein